MSIMVELRPGAGPALVVGGGAVAARKVRSLMDGGFRVTVVAPLVLDMVRELGPDLIVRTFSDADITGHGWALVFACTDDRETNRRVGELARAHGLPVLVADSQEESTFFSPAAHRDGDLLVAISTGGADPGLAKSIRERVVSALGSGWGERLAAARRARDERLGRGGGGDDE